MRKDSRALRTSLKRISAGGVVLALTTLGVFALPNAAFAAPPATSVVVAGNTVTATASPGVVNHITIANSGATGGGGVSIKDTGPAGPGTALTPNADCIQFSADEVRCDLGTITTLVVNAGDLDDTIADLNNSMGNITLNGGAGDDIISGGPVPETLNGDDGDDTLQGGAGADNLNGGANTSLTTKGDWVTYGAATAAVQVTIDDVANDGKDIDLVTAGIQPEGDNVGTTTENVEGSGQADFLTGSAFNNVLQGGGGADTLDGLAGDDTLQGEGGADDYQGGAGTGDIVSYGAVSAPVTADIDIVADDGANCPAVLTCEGDNIRVGVEIVVGGSGPDNLSGGTGNETLKGAGGNDTINGDVGTDQLFGGAGTDTVSYAGRGAAVTITLDGVANDGVGGENDNVFGDIENALGGSGGDTITGNTGVNRLDGGPGADTLNGGNGNDTLVGPGDDGAGDTYNGQGGTDTASFAGIVAPVIVTAAGGANDGVAGDNDDVTTTVENVNGGNGNDNITGNASANRLNGNAGDDQLTGDVGTDVSNDTLNGGLGNDGLHGMGGNDVMNGGAGPATGSDNDVIDGGLGVDTVSYSTRSANLSLTVDGVANDGQGVETDNIQADTEKITGGSGDDAITGDNGRDTLTGGNGDDSINGGGGNDTISGGGGNDILTGGGGKDILSGSTGNDTFHTSDGLKDSINCGDGNDNIADTDPVDTKTSNCVP
jgi:Ca2+-binding RTX toxin-like protein